MHNIIACTFLGFYLGWETFVRNIIQGDSYLSRLPIKLEIR